MLSLCCYCDVDTIISITIIVQISLIIKKITIITTIIIIPANNCFQLCVTIVSLLFIFINITPLQINNKTFNEIPWSGKESIIVLFIFSFMRPCIDCVHRFVDHSNTRL